MKGTAGISRPPPPVPFGEAAQRWLPSSTFRWNYAPLRRKA
ncbi:hypothetical protein ACVWYQ_007664 [Bradyrhizobium sp. USDA 3397]